MYLKQGLEVQLGISNLIWRLHILTSFHVNICEFVSVRGFTPTFDHQRHLDRAVALKLVAIVGRNSAHQMCLRSKLTWVLQTDPLITYRVQKLFIGFDKFSPIVAFPNHFSVFEKVLSNDEEINPTLDVTFGNRLLADFWSAQWLSTIMQYISSLNMSSL